MKIVIYDRIWKYMTEDTVLWTAETHNYKCNTFFLSLEGSLTMHEGQIMDTGWLSPTALSQDWK